MHSGLFDCLCLVVGNQERRAQFKTRMRKRKFRQRRGESGKHRDHWEMESGKGLLSINMQAFSWASHLKPWILQDYGVVWNIKD